MNESMGISVRKISLPTHKSNNEFGNNLKNKTKNPTASLAVSRAGDIRKSVTEKRKLETFTIAEGGALLWKSFIQKNSITAKQK